MKKGLKIFSLGIIMIYTILYLGYRNGYYQDINREKMILTDEKIKEYEEDLANGIDVSQKEYIVVAPNYDNNLTRWCLKISKNIEKSLDSTIKYIFKKINTIVED